MQTEWKKRLAEFTSDLLNPFLVSFIVILLLSFKSLSSPLDALKWSALLIAFSVLPIFVVIIYLVHNHKLESIFINARQQRNKIYLLASACTGIGSILLAYLGAPVVLVAAFVAGLSTTIIFMCINLLWKISVHTAFISASITTLIVLYGSAWAIGAVLLPPMVWARVELERHSPAQVAGGAILASVVVLVVFYLFGLIGATA